jgi:hypothetical protein
VKVFVVCKPNNFLLYCILGSGSALNNLKNRCRNFRKLFFYTVERESWRIFIEMENILSESSNNNNNLAQSAKLNPGLRYSITLVCISYQCCLDIILMMILENIQNL